MNSICIELVSDKLILQTFMFVRNFQYIIYDTKVKSHQCTNHSVFYLVNEIGNLVDPDKWSIESEVKLQIESDVIYCERSNWNFSVEIVW